MSSIHSSSLTPWKASQNIYLGVRKEKVAKKDKETMFLQAIQTTLNVIETKTLEDPLYRPQHIVSEIFDADIDEDDEKKTDELAPIRLTMQFNEETKLFKQHEKEPIAATGQYVLLFIAFLQYFHFYEISESDLKDSLTCGVKNFFSTLYFESDKIVLIKTKILNEFVNHIHNFDFYSPLSKSIKSEPYFSLSKYLEEKNKIKPNKYIQLKSESFLYNISNKNFGSCKYIDIKYDNFGHEIILGDLIPDENLDNSKIEIKNHYGNTLHERRISLFYDHLHNDEPLIQKDGLLNEIIAKILDVHNNVNVYHTKVVFYIVGSIFSPLEEPTEEKIKKDLKSFKATRRIMLRYKFPFKIALNPFMLKLMQLLFTDNINKFTIPLSEKEKKYFEFIVKNEFYLKKFKMFLSSFQRHLFLATLNGSDDILSHICITSNFISNVNEHLKIKPDLFNKDMYTYFSDLKSSVTKNLESITGLRNIYDVFENESSIKNDIKIQKIRVKNIYGNSNGEDLFIEHLLKLINIFISSNKNKQKNDFQKIHWEKLYLFRSQLQSLQAHYRKYHSGNEDDNFIPIIDSIIHNLKLDDLKAEEVEKLMKEQNENSENRNSIITFPEIIYKMNLENLENHRDSFLKKRGEIISDSIISLSENSPSITITESESLDTILTFDVNTNTSLNHSK